MILYQTIFNVDSQSKTLEDVKNICCEWLYASRNSNFNSKNLKFNAYEDIDIISPNHSERVLANYVDYNQVENFYFEYQKDIHKSNQWITIIAIEKHATNFKIGVKLKTISTSPRPDNQPIKKPLIISKLIDELGAAFDGEFLIDQINYLDNSTYWIETVSKFINGDFTGHLPCVYLSQPVCFNEEQIQDLQKELFGLAHIFIEPQDNYQAFSYKLKEASNSKNAYNGSIGIYWKDGFSKKLFLKTDQTAQLLINNLNRLVRSSLLVQKFPKNLTRHSILEKKFRTQIDGLKQKELKNPQDYEELIKLYDAEIEAKNKKILELENNSYQYDYQDFSREVNPEDSNNSFGIRFNIPQYFEKEIQHKMYNLLLELQVDNLGLSDRKKEIFEDIVSNIRQDKYYEEYYNQLEHLKNVLNDFKGNNTKLRKALSPFNIELSEDGKHLKANFRLDTRYPQSFAKTPSDNRAGKNIYRDFKKILY